MIALFDPLVAMTPIFVVVLMLEMVVARRRRPACYGSKDTITSVTMAVGNMLSGALFVVIPLSIGAALAPLRLFHLPVTIGVIALCFLADDFFKYWGHRMGHRVRWSWADHVIHHSSRHYNFSTAMRQGWFVYLTPGVITLIPLMIIGFPPEMIVFVHGLNLSYQFFIHTEHVGRLHPAIEFVMNTPSHHRVHHGSNPQYIDRNFGCVLILWDRIFGTFTAESETDPPRYGLTRDIGSFNIMRVASHEWVSIFRDLRTSKSIGEVCGYLFLPPGWKPARVLQPDDERRRAGRSATSA